jgi:hypothetical protein
VLWYKSWLETRFRLIFAIIFASFPIVLVMGVQHTPSAASPPTLAILEGMSGFWAFYWSLVSLNLAGSGIKTQATYRPTKGLHSSMLFTLSMPTSRFRLLATRAGLGLLETAAVLVIPACTMWIIFPGFRPQVSSSDLVKFWITLCLCATGFYGFGVLLSTLLDDFTQNWASIIGILTAWWLLSLPHVPSSANIFRAMGPNSPLFTHSLPWTSMGVSLSVGIILFLSAAALIRAREF